MSGPQFIEPDNEADLHQSATEFITVRLKASQSKNNRTTLFLSGGSTPKIVYQKLSRTDLDWAKIDIAQVDERWVSLSDDGSNAALLKNTILRNKAGSASFHRMKTRHNSAITAEPVVDARYRELSMKGSLAVLGMGTDGHVCSWFAGSDGLSKILDPANDNWVRAITAKRSNVTGAYLERMTLTLSAIKKCHSTLLLITGPRKRKLLNHVLHTGDPKLPVSHLIKASGQQLTIMCAG